MRFPPESAGSPLRWAFDLGLLAPSTAIPAILAALLPYQRGNFALAVEETLSLGVAAAAVSVGPAAILGLTTPMILRWCAGSVPLVLVAVWYACFGSVLGGLGGIGAASALRPGWDGAILTVPAGALTGSATLCAWFVPYLVATIKEWPRWPISLAMPVWASFVGYTLTHGAVAVFQAGWS